MTVRHKYRRDKQQDHRFEIHRKGKDAPVCMQEQSALSRYSSLPWEIRHHIHTFCVQGAFDNEVVVRRGLESRPKLLVRQSTGPYSYHWVKDPLLKQLRPTRIGVAAARDVLETYYRTRTFMFIHDELSTLRPFLETDTFSLAVHPADQVRRLQLQIQPVRYANFPEPFEKVQEERICREAMESLHILRAPSVTIEIHVDLAQGFCDTEEFNERSVIAAGFVFRTIGLVSMLRKEGWNVDVMFDGRWDSKDGTRLGIDTLPSLTDCITLMKLAWQ